MRLRPVDQAGFTLLEIMVVVMLMGLLTAVLVSQGNWTSDDRQLEEEAARLEDTLALLNERSLFSGQLLALRLQTTGWTPLAYDRIEGDFLPVDDTALKAHRLPPSLELVWELDDLGEDQARLSDVAETLVQDDVMAGTGEGLLDGEEGDESDQDDEVFPQVFFFPSGEVSPLTLTLRAYDNVEAEQRLRVSALGQFSDPDAENDEENEP
ncbi:MAG: type II secretion system minor pseudopilin GspH [Alcanivorax sp.]|uniref:type II secretion system minor pseudopilin GspH n=1 Tax=Alcanivorax sp. TaxID=1872427 RepID=UPI00262D75FD|nr:type II secretion system minor pseudopilin GspH [Alcanivorax sp.]MDF1724545.1 type II secretion system minor pseudopilin GspH [Alcanivorax sp.]